MRSHVGHDTSGGKKGQHELIATYFNPNGRRRSGYRYTLVGDAGGLSRHILENRREGFSTTSMVVVENVLPTYKSLCEENRGRVEIRYGDFIDVVRSDHSQGRAIAHLDFDGLSLGDGRYLDRFCSLLREVEAESYCFTYDPRGARCNDLAASLGLQRKPAKRRDGSLDPSLDQGKVRALRYRNKEVVERLTARLLPPPWTHSEVIGYQGAKIIGRQTPGPQGVSMHFIMGKRWDNTCLPFEDEKL